MASSRKSRRSKAGAISPGTHVAGRLKGVVRAGDKVVLALSGGVDSMVLLDILARLAKRMRFELSALHINHGLSPNAALWARSCRRACRARGVTCRVVRVGVERANSVERAARDARYAALAKVRADWIVLAHNKDDQVETVLLQLLRGTGLKGLAGMPLARTPRTGPVLVRPLLDVPRGDIESYARRRKLEWVEDESNADPRYTRNWLRREVLPAVASRVPAYRDALGRAAQYAAEASELLEALARIDISAACDAGGVRVDALRKLGDARARNLVRGLIAEGGWPMPQSQRLDEALRQALGARADARITVNLGACELRRHGERLHLVSPRAAAHDAWEARWQGERKLSLPQLGGFLQMARRRGSGLSLERLEGQVVNVRPRRGGERLQPEAGRPRRTVKNLLQEAGIPAWQRERLPFIYCGSTLVCVPGVGVDHRFRAKKGEASVLPQWTETE